MRPAWRLILAGVLASLSVAATAAPACRAHYDVAAYVWPSYHPDPRTKMFWPQGIGEWQTIAAANQDGQAQPGQFPLWGFVNEADPYVNEMEIAAAADHGVNVFIFDWYWYDQLPFLEGQLDDGYLKARNRDRVKFYLMWANHDMDQRLTRSIAAAALRGEPQPPVWTGGADRPTFEVIAHRMISRYFGQPSYYRIDGKPVLMIYDLDRFVHGLGGVTQARDAIGWFRAQVRQAGFPGLELQLALRDQKPSNIQLDDGAHVRYDDAIKAIGFDSGTHYQFAHTMSAHRPYDDLIADAKRQWPEFARQYGSLAYYPHVSIGWNPDPRSTVPLHQESTGGTPAKFAQSLRDAKAYLDAHPGKAPLVTINSWNEWTEGSYLEPDQRNGYGYLDAVKSVFDKDDTGAGCGTPGP